MPPSPQPKRLLLLTALALTWPAIAVAGDSFSITTSNGLTLDQDSQHAGIRWATDDMWHFATRKMNVRVAARRLGDDPVASGEELDLRNTGLKFEEVIDGTNRHISCKTAEETPAQITRTALSESRVAGSFTLEMVSCNDFYTSEPIAYPGLPITVEGRFDVTRKN